MDKVHSDLEDAIITLQREHFQRGGFNHEIGSVEWWNERNDIAIILHNSKGFFIHVTFSDIAKRSIPHLKRNGNGNGNGVKMTYSFSCGGGEGDNDASSSEQTPQEIASQENCDKAFEELVEIVTENSGEGGRDSSWE